MVILMLILIIPLCCLPFLLLYWIVRLAVRHGINDSKKINNTKSVYNHGYRYYVNDDD